VLLRLFAALIRGDVHEPNIGLCCDVRVEERAVVAGEGGAADVDVLIGNYQDLLVFSSLRVEEEKSPLTDKQQAAVVVEPDGPVAEVRQPIISLRLQIVDRDA